MLHNKPETQGLLSHFLSTRINKSFGATYQWVWWDRGENVKSGAHKYVLMIFVDLKSPINSLNIAFSYEKCEWEVKLISANLL